MTAEKIAAIMAGAVGDPSVGPVAEAIPAMAQAVADALAPVEDEPKDAKRK